MSVLIKGATKPESCGNCFFDTRCDKWRARNWGSPPPPDCPLVEIPPHGRLTDADALLQRAIPHGWSTPKWVSDIAIEDAPTIIEAEEKQT